MTAIPNSVPVRRTSAEHLVAAGRVEAVGRLVEQQQPGSWTSAWASLTRCFMPVE